MERRLWMNFWHCRFRWYAMFVIDFFGVIQSMLRYISRDHWYFLYKYVIVVSPKQCCRIYFGKSWGMKKPLWLIVIEFDGCICFGGVLLLNVIMSAMQFIYSWWFSTYFFEFLMSMYVLEWGIFGENGFQMSDEILGWFIFGYF